MIADVEVGDINLNHTTGSVPNKFGPHATAT